VLTKPAVPMLVSVTVLIKVEFAWYVYAAERELSITLCNRPAVS